MKSFYISIIGLLAIFATGCEYDNYDEPTSKLSGIVNYEGQPVGIRSNGARFELWQDGFELNTSIEVDIAQNGTYSAVLFDGEYKLVRIAGAPWEPQLTDTIVINVNGNTSFDVPVTPYYFINNESFTKQGNNLDVSFNLEKVVETSGINAVNIYFGKNFLTDNNYNYAVTELDVNAVSVNSSNSFQVEIPSELLDEGYLFVRIGVKSTSSNEFYFTQTQRIDY